MTETTPTLSPPSSHPENRLRSRILMAVSLGTFMTYIDNNIINVAIPTIQRDLHLSQAGIEWVVSSYVLLFAGLLLAGGRLADVLGRRRMFVVGLVIFTVASLAAGLSSGGDLLIASRAVQGLGAALLTPTTLAIISATFPAGPDRARAIGMWGAVGALGLALGPLLGGLLSQHVSWHWIFFINVPVGLVTLLVAVRAMPDALDVTERRPLDLGGVASSAGALLALAYGLIQGPQQGWTDPTVLVSLIAAGLFALGFVVIERRVSDPMIDLSLFASRAFAGGTAAVMLWAFGLFGIYFFTSLYLQDVLGFSPSKSGAAFVPMALLMAVGAALSDRIAPRVGAHRLVGTGLVVMGAAIISVAFLGAHANLGELMPSFVVMGAAAGFTIPLTNTVVNAMPPERAGVASGVFNASREVAGLLGITVIGVILTAREHAQLHAGHAHIAAFLSGYRLGLVVSGVLVTIGGVIAWLSLAGVDDAVEIPDPGDWAFIESEALSS